MFRFLQFMCDFQYLRKYLLISHALDSDRMLTVCSNCCDSLPQPERARHKSLISLKKWRARSDSNARPPDS